MSKMHQLKRTLCRELDELAAKTVLNMGELEMAQKITDTIKNIDKISMLEEGEQSAYNYSGRVANSYGGSYRDSFDDGTYRSYRRGRSMSGANDQMVEHLRMMANKSLAPDERKAIEWALGELE